MNDTFPACDYDFMARVVVQCGGMLALLIAAVVIAFFLDDDDPPFFNLED